MSQWSGDKEEHRDGLMARICRIKVIRRYKVKLANQRFYQLYRNNGKVISRAVKSGLVDRNEALLQK